MKVRITSFQDALDRIRAKDISEIPWYADFVGAEMSIIRETNLAYIVDASGILEPCAVPIIVRGGRVFSTRVTGYVSKKDAVSV